MTAGLWGPGRGVRSRGRAQGWVQNAEQALKACKAFSSRVPSSSFTVCPLGQWCTVPRVTDDWITVNAIWKRTAFCLRVLPSLGYLGHAHLTLPPTSMVLRYCAGPGSAPSSTILSLFSSPCPSKRLGTACRYWNPPCQRTPVLLLHVCHPAAPEYQPHVTFRKGRLFYQVGWGLWVFGLGSFVGRVGQSCRTTKKPKRCVFIYPLLNLHETSDYLTWFLRLVPLSQTETKPWVTTFLKQEILNSTLPVPKCNIF